MSRKVQTTRGAVQEGFLRPAVVMCRNRVLLYGIIAFQVGVLSFLLCDLSFCDDYAETSIVTFSPSIMQSFSVAEVFRGNGRDGGSAGSPSLHHSVDG